MRLIGLNISYCKYTVTLKPSCGSLKVIGNDIDPPPMTSYELVTMGFSRTISEINGAIAVENRYFSTPVYFVAPAEGVSLGILHRRLGSKN